MRVFAVVLLFSLAACSSPSTEESAPRLLVMMTVDGLSIDQIVRHRDCYGEGGFERLFDQGVWMREGRYAHATTWTAAGHATVATGTSPRTHGLVANQWLDRVAGKEIYCVSDPDHVRLNGASGEGTSPRNLLVPTIADHLHDASDGRSRALAVSIKDRGAITGAGRHGDAYFYSTADGRFITSTFYMDTYPAWWNEYYAGNPQDRWFGAEFAVDVCGERTWFADHAASLEYVDDDDDRRAIDPSVDGGLLTPGRAYYGALRETPFGDEATLEFARTAVEAEGLGSTSGVTDLLFLSLSAHDYIGHSLGPDSPQATAHVVALDRMFAAFMQWLDATIGEDAWTFVLTADHGFPSAPEVVRARGRNAGRVDAPALEEVVERALTTRYGEGDWVLGWAVPCLYLNLDLVAARGLDLDEVLSFGRDAIRMVPGVRDVITRTEIERGEAHGEFGGAMAAAWHPERSGDLMVVQQPWWYLLDDPHRLAATHGSPYDYDTRVPIMFLGKGIGAFESEERAHVRDIVPTLLDVLGIDVDATFDGEILHVAPATPSSR